MRKPKIRDEVLRGVCEPEYTQFLRDAIPEIEMLMAMENHPLRTKNTEDAKQFIVPIPIGAIMIHKRHSRNQFEYPSAMNALFQQPTFQKMQGHNHVLISQAIPPFSAMRKHVRAMSVHRLTQFYPQLANVTVAQEMNRRGCAQLLQQRNISSTGAFISMCNTVVDRLQYATTRKTFSINFVPQSSMPYQEASYGNWLSKELFIFYQTTFKPSFNGSTKYRRAPLDPKVVRHLPKSSIGYGVSKKEWLKGMTSAKFCLAVRGDNPLSHAFLNAVKAGCLPVIVSDVIPLFAPPFMSSIDIHDYTIFIREKDFIDNTLHELRKLQRMSDLELRTKLRALALAQRVIAPDHPRSLFVPAFLREAALAEPSPTIFEVLDSGNHTLQNVRYVRARTGK